MGKFMPVSEPSITQKEIDYVTDAVSSGWVSSIGMYVEEFEKRFSLFCNTKYALTTSSGTTALHLALATLNVNEGDEVIIPDFTFVATANAVAYTGATVVPVDIEKDTLCIAPQRIKEAITDRTKAILPVHIYGHPANMTEICAIAKKYNLYIIEDAAEAHGAAVGGKKVGSLGNVGVFSFYGNKIITCGEGGMLVTNDEQIYLRAKRLRDHAMSGQKRYWHTDVGFNYRMTNLQAALGVAQMERIDNLLKRREEVFELYRKELLGFEGIRLNYCAPWAKNVYWMICLQVEDYSESERNSLMEELKDKGIDTRPYFYPVSDMPMYETRCYTENVHSIYKTGINLPTYFDLTDNSISYICDQLKMALEK